jgi:photosystem II stability/assembly factor-like uncharacterized protein
MNMKQILPLILCLALSVSQAEAQPLFSSWEWSHPKPQGNRLNDVSMLDVNIGFAVGETGSVLKTEDGGLSWTLIQDIGVQDDLMAVSVVNSNNLWVAGDNGLIFHSADLGQNWTQQTTPPGVGMLRSLFFLDDQKGWAAGNGGITLRTQDGGSTWTQLGTHLLVTNQLRSIFFTDDQKGHVVGGGGSYLYTDDGGDSWTVRSNTGVTTALNTVNFASELVGYVGGNSQIIRKTIDGGLTWMNTSPGTISDVWDIFLLDENIVWFATGNGIYYTFNGMNTPIVKVTGTPNRVYRGLTVVEPSTGVAVGSNGVMARSSNPSSFWLPNGNLETTAPLNSIKVLPGTSVGYAVGNSRWVLKTTNEGDSWSGQQVGTNVTWLDLGFTSPSVGVIAGFSGEIGSPGRLFRTANGGATWTDITANIPDSPAPRLFGVHNEPGSPSFYLCGDGGSIYLSSDNGLTWVAVPAFLNPGTEDLNDITFAPGVNRGYAVGNHGQIVSTANGGVSWSLQSSGTTEELIQVFALNNQTAWVVGDNGVILKTTNAGTTWTSQSLPSGMDVDLLGVFFLDASIGWVTGLESSIFFTEDGGTTWTTQPNPAPGFLRNFAAFDQDNIFVCGANGVILKTTMLGIPFPVELVSFRAERDGQLCQLYWETASETDNEGFEIQRSPDGRQWNSIGWVDAQGSIERFAAYQWTDQQPHDGLNYYRLRQLDYAGTEAFSDIVTVWMDAKLGVFSVFPNPATDAVQVSIDLDTDLQLFSSFGNLLRSYTLPAGQHELSLGDLPAGLYFLVDARGNRTVRLMIQ